MAEDIANLRVLVTAGCAGIGRAIADTFADAGAKIHVCDISDEAIEACRRERPGYGISRADVSNEQDVERLFKETLEHLGGLDVLVNNAGISGPTAPIDEISFDDWRRTIEVGLDSLYLCTKQAVAPLKEISAMIAFTVLSRSVSPRKSRSSTTNDFIFAKRPFAS